MPNPALSARQTVTRKILVFFTLIVFLSSIMSPLATLASDPDPSEPASPSASPTAEPTAPAPSAAPAPSEPPAPSTEPTPAPSEPAAPGDVLTFIVTFAAGSGPAAESALLDSVGAVEVGSVAPLRMRVVELSAVDASSALDALRASALVARVDLDRTREVEATPSDSSYIDQWSLPKVGWDQLYGTVGISGSSTVAILDTGVDASHPDLDGVVLPGTSVLDGSSGLSDPNGHGTWMAGIVAAETDNGFGIAGTAYAGVSILPVTVLGADGTGQDSDIIAGVVYAADHGADVILMSFSNPGYSAALQAAIDYAWASGAVLVAATGNDSSGTATFPAGDRGVIGVASTDQSDALAASSNYGPAAFMAAPGVDIATTSAGGGVAGISGTSAAAAQVAGAAALLKSNEPFLSNGVIVSRLARNADPAGDPAQTGNGRLNLLRAMADGSTDSIQPAGAAPVGSGGPLVGPYVALAQENYQHWGDLAPAGWQNGALQQSNAAYLEGEVVPHWFTSKNLTKGATYAFNVYYDYLDGSACGFDYLDDYNASRTTTFKTANVPALDAAPLFPGGAGSFYTVNANVTSISGPVTVGIQQYVTVTFVTPTGGGGTIDTEFYFGLHLATPGGACPQGSDSWPGASLQTDIKTTPAVGGGVTMVGGGGSLQINPNAVARGTIAGFKYSDANGSGTFTTGEAKLPGWTIQLSTTADFATIAQTATTDSAGNYSFNVLAGTYYVREVQQGGWTQTAPGAPGYYTVTISSAAPNSANNNFGNRQSAPALTIDKTSVDTSYASVGDVLDYSYLVTNSGNVTLSGPFTVSDDKASDESCPATASLAPGASISCSASYTVTQADLDAGAVTNVASASNGTTTSATDSLTIDADQNPALTIDKTSVDASYTSVGDVLDYSYLVTNSGNVTLSGPFTVSDDKASDESCPATASLAPGASITCSASYTVTQADLDGGAVTNVASASNGTTTSTTDTLTINATQTPELTLAKDQTANDDADENGEISLGDTLTYTLVATNSGNVTLSDVAISDPMIGLSALSCTPTQPTTLAPNATLECTATYVVTQADVDEGMLVNSATVRGESPQGDPEDADDDVTDSDAEIVLIPQHPALSIDKTSVDASYASVGDVLDYSYLVTNSGNVTLSGPFTVSDDKASDESCPATASLAPGASISCSASYTVTQADLDAGAVTNVASASNGTTTSATDSLTIDADQNPALTIDKTSVDASYTSVGDVLDYSYLVTNSGNVTLSGPFTVSDDKASDESCPATASLAPGASITCSASYTVTQADLDGGAVTNVASASNGTTTSTTDTLTINATQTPELTLAKDQTANDDADENGEISLGDTLTYTLVATNSGNVTLSDVAISDPMIGLSALSCTPTQPTTLAPNATLECTATYVVTQADVDEGMLVNSATVRGESPQGDPEDADDDVTDSDAEIVLIPQHPALSIDKTSVDASYASVGDVLDYSYLVTNSGNVTLSGPFTVSDDKASDESCPATASLAPGASISCSASYTVTQADLDAGAVTNVASASNGTTTSATDSLTIDATQLRTIAIDKEGTLALGGNGQADPGDLISYTFEVTNSGNVTLSGVTVSDPELSNESCPLGFDGVLSPGESVTCSGSYALSQADIDAGEFTNVADADATAPQGQAVNDDDTETVNIPQLRTIAIDKEGTLALGGNGQADPGDLISYTFEVTNSGNVTLSGVTVSDPELSNESCPLGFDGVLSPGESVTCSGSYALSQADIDAGEFTNVADADATAPQGQAVNDDDTETVNIPQLRTIAIDKEGTLALGGNGQADPGDLISYTFEVTNSGNVTLSGVTVSDPELSNESCPLGFDGVLSPGESVTCSGSYALSQADIDAGEFTNVADADATAPQGQAVNDDDTETVNIPQLRTIAIDKEGTLALGGNGQADPGDLISYTFEVTNSGNVTLSGVTVSDPELSNESCPLGFDGVLSPGESVTCSGSYALSQADIDAGEFTNVADADATAPQGQAVNDDDTETVNIPQLRTIAIDKEGTLALGGNGQADPGDLISYTFEVTNSGNVTLSGVTVSDPELSNESCPLGFDGVLSPGESVTCSGSYALSQADIDAGEFTNVADADATAPQGQAVNDDDTETVNIPQLRTIAIDKEGTLALGGNGQADPGDLISYTFEVTNSGNVTLSGVTVSDPELSNESCPLGFDGVLSPGESVTCSGSYALSQADIDAGEFTNVADADATAPQGQAVNDDDTETVNIPQLRTIAIDKEGTLALGGNGQADPGDLISYTFEVTNSGNVTLSGVTVSDPELSNESCPLGFDGVLSPGESVTCSGSYALSQADIDAGEFTNVADADATAPQGQAVNDDDTETVNIPQLRTIAIDKEGTLALGGNGQADPGDLISYTFEVTNSGNVTLSGVTVSDPELSNESCPLGFDGVLSPGESVTCSGSYALSQADIDAGEFTNVADADATAPQGQAVNDDDTETVNIPQLRTIAIDKEGTLALGGNGQADPGDLISYTFEVTNSGNVTLSGVTVSDPELSNESCPLGFDGVLSPGESVTCSGSYALSQADIDAGEFTNVADADATAPQGQAVNDDDTETVNIPQLRTIAIDKEGTLALGGNGQADPGDLISYTFEVTNSGNVTLSGVTVSDPELSNESCPLGFDGVLSPGESVTCSGSYALSQADIDAGEFTNVADADATAPRGQAVNDDDTETVNIPQLASLDLEKGSVPSSYSAAGQPIVYTFTVENTGNVTLHAVQISDSKCTPLLVDGDTDNDNLLDVTETWSYSCTYLTSQADVDAGSLTNIATASALGPQNQPASDSDSVTINVVITSGSQMTNSAFQLVDDLTPWAVNDFEILVNGQNTVVATNPGQFYYHQRATSPYSVATNWTFNLSWPCQFMAQTTGGQPIHAYIQLATDAPNTWTLWSDVSGVSWTNTTFPSGCAQPAGTPPGLGTITVNNVPAGATVWVNVHLDYAAKGKALSTLTPDPTKKPVTYGPFSSAITMKIGPAVVGTSFSSTSVVGRGKKVTMTYGVARDSSGNALANTWVRVTQGALSATALTGSDGFYVMYDGQICAATDGLAGGCFSGSTAQPATAVWNFGNGNTSTTVRILGSATFNPDLTPVIPAYNAAPAWPTGTWSLAKVMSGSTTYTTITHPNPLAYTFTVSKGTAYNRDWRFTP